MNPIPSQPCPNPHTYINAKFNFNMWSWMQILVQYAQVRECWFAPAHSCRAPTYESAPPWECQRWFCAKEGQTSVCWICHTGICLRGILGYNQEFKRQKTCSGGKKGCCFPTWCWLTKPTFVSRILIIFLNISASSCIFYIRKLPSCFTVVCRGMFTPFW